MATSFIETQFPIARLSAEAYRERKAVAGQTLTGLGKWWGRKPLILVRASILGMVMPVSNDPKKDREIFLKILCMDDQGTWERNSGRIRDQKQFNALPYPERLKHSIRPENHSGPTGETWAEINSHLNTEATDLSSLISQLSQRIFGHTAIVGDCFCGGGSIPFEAARMGCEAFGSDLNPVAGLLTWASLNLIGNEDDAETLVSQTFSNAFSTADKQILEWGIETNEKGERADAYIYCAEVKPEGSNYFIPLAPSWVISTKFKIVVEWSKKDGSSQLEPKVTSLSDEQFKNFEKNKCGATVLTGRISDPFDNTRTWSVEGLRGVEGLRRWGKDDLVPRPGDVLQERLYCIRWVDKDGNRRYAAPDQGDIEREQRVLSLLSERVNDWQKKGFIPSGPFPENGEKTDEPLRTRGWSHWHHLFTPRQLLVHGLLASTSDAIATSDIEKVGTLLAIGRMANWNSRLCRWLQTQGGGIGGGKDTFSNQALNPMYNFSVRPMTTLRSAGTLNFKSIGRNLESTVLLSDARDLIKECDIWITDPPYADAINYHELGDFFLAWYEKALPEIFSNWIPDSRAELAVKGDGNDFRRSMVEVYKNLSSCMPDNGSQMVMFTHQNPAVWADLGMILWAAGLKATAAWTISTETEAVGIKKGNYVQGTVCLVLRKRTSDEPGFLDEVYPLVEDEVKNQISSMQALDEGEEPNFNDADYQLAAYAAALKVLTQYGNLDGKEVEHEVFATRARSQKSDFQIVIERALEIACNTLVPSGLEDAWRHLSLTERYYLRALDIESRGERRKGMYEELARGFGVSDIRPLLKSDTANGSRMFTPTGFGSSILAPPDIADQAAVLGNSLSLRNNSGSNHPFASSNLRHLIFAISETAGRNNDPEPGRQYLRDTFGQAYWEKRGDFLTLLDWLSALGNSEGMDEWVSDSEGAKMLRGRLRNDHS